MSVQVSAYISDETKENMEHYSEMYGIKKGYLIENAISHYLQAMYEIPEEFVIPTNIHLTKDSFEKVADSIEKPPAPTKKLVELMREG